MQNGGQLLRGRVLGDVCDSRDNNFNLIRVVAAAAVLVSHAWPITQGNAAVEPLKHLLGESLGALAVFTFFAISGFLIARSFERQPTVGGWVRARVLRLLPALFVVLLLTVAISGLLVTDLPLVAYLADPATLTYVPRNLSLAFLQYDLPGVFRDQPVPGAINGSLWTLFYEVVCYGGVLAVGLLGGLRFRSVMLLAMIGFALVYGVIFFVLELGEAPYRLEALARLALPFALGTAFYVWRRHVFLHSGLFAALIVATVLLRGTPVFAQALVLTLVYGVFVLAYLPGGTLRRYNLLGDYSYGIYIYAYPVQQLMVHAFQPLSPLENIALALPVTAGLAVVSWIWIEKPALAWAHTSGSRRHQGFGSVSGPAGRSAIRGVPPGTDTTS